jgi:hypothetical protein
VLSLPVLILPLWIIRESWRRNPASADPPLAPPIGQAHADRVRRTGRGRGHPAVEHGGRGPRVDSVRRGQRGRPRSRPPTAWSPRLERDQRGGGVEQDRVAHGPGLPASRSRTAAALNAGRRRAGVRAATRAIPSREGSSGLADRAPAAHPPDRDVVAVVSSSSPSSPRTTSADTPRRANTSAITPAIRASAQPMAWAPGWAGLVSGPRKLNAVATRARAAAPPRTGSRGGTPGRSRT